MDPVVVSSEMCATEQAEIHSSELPNLCSDSVSGPRNVSVKLGDKVDKPNLQCIDVGNLGGTSHASAHSSDPPIFLDMDDPGSGLPVLEYRYPLMVLDFASDIDPGPGNYFWRAGRTLSWPACIGFMAPGLGECMLQSGWLPWEMDFTADLSPRADTFLLCHTGMDGGWIYVHSGRDVHEVFLQRWGGRMYSDSVTGVTGVVSDTSVTGVVSDTSVTGVVSDTSVTGVVSDTSVTGVVSDTSVTGVVSDTSVTGVVSDTSVTGVVSDTSVTGVVSDTSVTGVVSDTSVTGVVSDTSVTGVVSDVTGHWPGLACRPDLLNSIGSSGRSLGRCCSSPIDATGIPGILITRFGKFLLEPAGVETLLLVFDYVHPCPIGCLFSSRSLAG